MLRENIKQLYEYHKMLATTVQHIVIACHYANHRHGESFGHGSMDHFHYIVMPSWNTLERMVIYMPRRPPVTARLAHAIETTLGAQDDSNLSRVRVSGQEISRCQSVGKIVEMYQWCINGNGCQWLFVFRGVPYWFWLLSLSTCWLSSQNIVLECSGSVLTPTDGLLTKSWLRCTKQFSYECIWKQTGLY